MGMIWYCYIIKNIMSLTDETGDKSMLNEVNQIRRINTDFFLIYEILGCGENVKGNLLEVWYGEVGRKGEEI